MKSLLLIPACLLAGILQADAQEQNKTESQTPVQAQTPQPVSQDSVKHPKTTATFIGGLVFAPHLHYYGRTDELKSDAFLPTVNIEFDSVHIYVSATGVFINNSREDLQYAGTIVEAGYRFGKLAGFSGNIYGNKFFYNTTQLPQSALKEQAGTNLAFHTKPLNFTATGSAAFSDARTDFFTSAGINHVFKKKYKKSVLLFTPTYVLNMGSQNFTTVNNKTGVSSTDALFEEQTNRFKVLDHEISMPVIYARKHVYYIATPSYIRPENVVTIPNHPELSERGRKLFYINLTVLYTFKK